MNGISFKAKCINYTTIDKQISQNKYCKKNVAFAKMNNNSYYDVKALKELSYLWDYDSNLIPAIYLYFSLEDGKNSEIYFLTSQTKNFKKIIPEKVLGIIQITNHPKYEYLNYIQTRPDCTAAKQNRPYKNIGQTMINLVKKITENKDIVLNSIKEAIEFYKKQGFKVIKNNIPEPKMILKK